MPYKKYVFRKVVRKIFVTISLFLVFVFNLVFKLTHKLFRFIFLPVGLVSGAAGLTYMISAKEFDQTAISLIVLGMIAALGTYSLPWLTGYLDEVLEYLKYDFYQPIIPKPPVRYRYMF